VQNPSSDSEALEVLEFVTALTATAMSQVRLNWVASFLLQMYLFLTLNEAFVCKNFEKTGHGNMCIHFVPLLSIILMNLHWHCMFHLA
jgi:hypothetical protein